MTQTIKVGKLSIQLDDACRIAGYIRGGKTFEPDTLLQFAQDVRPGSTVIDVGCYSGLFSILATKLRARAIGFEPFPDNRTQIKKNMFLNGVRFSLNEEAVSESKGTARLGYNPKVPLTAGASLLRKSGPGIMVKKIALDDIEFEDVSVIKIDVERNEPAVLRGARNTIEAHRPILFVESLDDDARVAIERELDGLDYHVASVLDVRNLVIRPRNGPRG